MINLSMNYFLDDSDEKNWGNEKMPPSINLTFERTSKSSERTCRPTSISFVYTKKTFHSISQFP